MATTRDAIIFRRALGLTDSTAIGTQIMKTDPRDRDGAGDTEFTDCLNLTTTPDGCVEKVAALASVLDTGAPVTYLSAGKRFFFSDGLSTKEWVGGTSIVDRFPIVAGPVAHTPIDARICGGSTNYKSTNAVPTMAVASVGTNPDPATSVAYSAMPLFKQAFVFNAKLYALSKADSRFLHYSKDYHYDLFNLGDGYIASQYGVLQSGAIPGVLITTHNEGITVYKGMTPTAGGLTKKFYPCAPIDNTLFSGFISKNNGHGHVLLCDDGVYFIGEDGAPVNLTLEQTAQLGRYNSTYHGATVHDGKYKAVGGTTTLEYNFRTKTLLKQATQGATDTCVWNGVYYAAVGSHVMAPTVADPAMPCSFTLPFSDLSQSGRKRIMGLYFTGTATGRWRVTATDRAGTAWRLDRNDSFENATDQYIKTPHSWLGNHISFKVECITGDFRVEELRAVVATSNHSK